MTRNHLLLAPKRHYFSTQSEPGPTRCGPEPGEFLRKHREVNLMYIDVLSKQTVYILSIKKNFKGRFMIIDVFYDGICRSKTDCEFLTKLIEIIIYPSKEVFFFFFLRRLMWVAWQFFLFMFVYLKLTSAVFLWQGLKGAKPRPYLERHSWNMGITHVDSKSLNPQDFVTRIDLDFGEVACWMLGALRSMTSMTLWQSVPKFSHEFHGFPCYFVFCKRLIHGYIVTWLLKWSFFKQHQHHTQVFTWFSPHTQTFFLFRHFFNSRSSTFCPSTASWSRARPKWPPSPTKRWEIAASERWPCAWWTAARNTRRGRAQTERFLAQKRWKSYWNFKKRSQNLMLKLLSFCWNFFFKEVVE